MGDMAELSSTSLLSHVPVVFLDVETTGLDPKIHEIVEAAVVDVSGAVLLDQKYAPRDLSVATEEALRINGYEKHPELWDGAPSLDVVEATRLLKVLEDRIIVAQNPYFDLSFVREGFRRVNVDSSSLSRHAIDTTTLIWEHLVPCGIERLGLEFACDFLGVPLDRAERHSALKDAQAVRVVYLMLLRATKEQCSGWCDQARRRGLLHRA
jgi:DNA polymerase-3 subunit alpha (Gram-positive type)